MGLFQRKAQTPSQPEQRSIETDYGYSYPLSLSLRKYGNPSTISAVFAAIELISNSLAQIPIHIRNKKTGEIISHPLDLVFNGGLMTKFMLIKMLISDMLQHGDGLAYIERAADGTPINIIYCAHGTYTIQYDETKRSLFYQIPTIKRGKIEPINVIHIYKNSMNGVEGKGILTYASRTIAIANATENSAKDYFESGCAVSGVLKSTRPLTEQQKLDIKTSWNSAMSNTGNSIAVLGNDLEYTAVGSNASDAQMLETRSFNITEIARFFNINPQLIGDLEHTQYGSIEQAQLELVTHTLMPMIALMEDEFNRKLFRPSESNLYIDFDENHLMKADKAATANYYSTLVSNGIMTVNECREEMNLKPIEGGDELRVYYSDTTQNDINNENTKTDDK